jgi:hypothetical protein
LNEFCRVGWGGEEIFASPQAFLKGRGLSDFTGWLAIAEWRCGAG